MNLHTLAWGKIAARALRSPGPGRVEAVFQRSFYLHLNGAMICFGGADIGHGPLNVPCAGAIPADWQAVMRAADEATCDGRVLRIGSLGIRVDQAAEWSPSVLPPWEAQKALRGCAALNGVIADRVPSGGLGGLLQGGIPRGGQSLEEAVIRTATPAIRALADWAVHPGEPEAVPDVLPQLLGLGPGLTPSGDDFLGGFLVALRAAGRPSAAEALGREIAIRAKELTNAISQAHLRAAIECGLGEETHALLGALLSADAASVERGIASLEKRPHHSPWDILAGIVTAIDAVIRRDGV